MPKSNRVTISVTPENLWFLERYLNVFDFMELFPPDCVSKSDGSPGIPINFVTDRGFTIESDIDCAKMQLRSRSKIRGWMRWTSEHELRSGDVITIEKSAEREYALRLARPSRF